MKKSTLLLTAMVICIIAFVMVLVWPYISNYINVQFFDTNSIIDELSSTIN